MPLNTCSRFDSQKLQHGFGLIEVLVAVLLLSFGMLGLAGLQLSTLRNTNSASNRYEATEMAYDILDRMRANQPQVTTGAYVIAVGTVPTGTDVAGTDLVAWKLALKQIPSGDGSIEINGRVVTVTVQWNEGWDLDTALAGGFAKVLLRTQM